MLENDVINIYWTDVYGRVYNEYGDLAPGVYIQVEEYIDGQIITRKIFMSFSFAIPQITSNQSIL